MKRIIKAKVVIEVEKELDSYFYPSAESFAALIDEHLEGIGYSVYSAKTLEIDVKEVNPHV